MPLCCPRSEVRFLHHRQESLYYVTGSNGMILASQYPARQGKCKHNRNRSALRPRDAGRGSTSSPKGLEIDRP